jgi:hypothetical protein
VPSARTYTEAGLDISTTRGNTVFRIVLPAEREEVDELPFMGALREGLDLPVLLKKEASVYLCLP